ATGKELLKVAACDAGVGAVAFLPDGKSVLSGDREGAVRRWDVSTGKELERVGPPAGGGTPDQFTCLDWSPAGKRVVTGRGEGGGGACLGGGDREDGAPARPPDRRGLGGGVVARRQAGRLGGAARRHGPRLGPRHGRGVVPVRPGPQGWCEPGGVLARRQAAG